ncbi:MAG TPA: hypothetical protein ENJ00_05680 [Phycisphaerales bacterium]|nr:hypothetical protein [Phycisphaerales bacterium]
MLKFLRKYNKWILVIGGSLLMVAFLAPQAIQQLGKLNDRTIADFDGKPLKASVLRTAANELRSIDALGGTGNLSSFLLSLDTNSQDRDIQWFLLTHEAEQAGFTGSDQDGLTLYPFIAEQLALANVRAMIQQNPQFQSIAFQLVGQYRDQWLQRIQSTEGSAAGAGQFHSIEEFRKAIAKLRGVLRMREAYARTGRYSTNRVARMAKQTFDAAETSYVVIPSERFIRDVPEPTEEQIAEHYEQYKDKLPADTEFGIGYRQPDRIKLEWLAVERAPIEAAITIDPVEASKYQQLHPDQFPGTFSEEKPRIEAELRRKKADDILNQVENFVRAEMLRASRTLEREGNYLKLPDNWAEIRPSLDQIAETIVQRIKEANDGLEIPKPKVIVHDESWLAATDIVALPGIGFSQIRYGSTQLPITAALFNVRELNPNPTLAIQTGVLASEFPATGFDGSRFFFRILAAHKASPPDSIDEVRDEVIKDIKRIAAYDDLTQRLSTYAEVAINSGLDDVVAMLNAGLPDDTSATVGDFPDRISITDGVTLRSRIGRGTPPIFQDQTVLDSAFEISKSINPTLRIEDVPLPDRTYVVPAPKSLAVVVGRIDKVVPLTREDFAIGYNDIANTLLQLELTDLGVTDNPFSLERLMARHNFKMRQKDGDEPETQSPESSESTESDSDS